MINQNSKYVSNLKFNSSGIHTRYGDFMGIWNVCTSIPSIICMFCQNSKKSIFKQKQILTWGCEVLMFCNVGSVGWGAHNSKHEKKHTHKKIFLQRIVENWDLQVWCAATVVFFLWGSISDVAFAFCSAYSSTYSHKNMFNLTQMTHLFLLHLYYIHCVQPLNFWSKEAVSQP